MEMPSNKKRNYSGQEIEPVCRQKRNFPPSYGSERAMLSVVELIFLAMTMLFHIDTQAWQGYILISFLLHFWAYTRMLYICTTDPQNIPYSGNLSWGKTFRNFAVSGQFVKVLTHKNFHWVRRRHYQWVCHCRFPQFEKVLIAKIWLSAIHESFHPWKIPAIR